MVFRRALLATAAAALVFAPQLVSAQFVNPGFELPALPPGGSAIFGTGANVGGWTVVGPQVLHLSSTYTEPNGVGNVTLTFNSHSGLHSMDLTGSGNWGTGAGVEQSVATVLGQRYNLSFWMGKATGNGFYATPSVLDLSINGGSRVTFTNSNNVPNAIDWQLYTYGFTATSASTLFTFYNGTPLSSNNMVGLDDVELAAVSVVPEPSSMVLMAGGLIALAGFARRRGNGRSA
jgi:hypothetical protein